MFKRRKSRSTGRKIREFVWPTMGWGRFGSYLRHRVVRLPDNSRRIAAGLAIGVSVSFTPFIGTHLIQAAALAYITRTNMIAAWIGTLIGNPWTFPFMWWAAMWIGTELLRLFGIEAGAIVPEKMSLAILWDIIKTDPVRIVFPWTIGGCLLALVSWPISYSIFYNMVKGAKRAQKRARLRKLKKLAKEVTRDKEEPK